MICVLRVAIEVESKAIKDVDKRDKVVEKFRRLLEDN